MLIISLTVLSILLILFRILRGESVMDIHREIKELKAQDVPHYFWWAPVAAFPFVAALTILLPILLFKRKDTKFGFAKHEAENFAVKHGIASLWRNK